MFETVFQLAIEMVFGFLVITCGVPAEESKDALYAATEPARIVCLGQVNNTSWVVAGYIWQENDLDQLPKFK